MAGIPDAPSNGSAYLATANLRKIVKDGWRSAEQDLEYHAKAYERFDQLCKLVTRAEGFLAAREGDAYLPPEIRELQRMLLQAWIAHTRKLQKKIMEDDDAFTFSTDCQSAIDDLIDATAQYIHRSWKPEWAIPRLRAGLELWQ